MHPILFEIPGIGFPVRSFGVMVAVGFIVGTTIWGRLTARHGSGAEGEAERYGAVPVWILFGIVIGARLMYVVVELAKGSRTGQEYLRDPFLMLAIWQGGLVMYGGLFGGIVAGLWCGKRQRLPLRHGLDIGLSAGFFGYAIGRVGCLLVGDDYGAVVPERWRHLPFPITLHVPEKLPPHSLFGSENAGQVLWATQPWMALNGLLLGLLGLWLLRRRQYPGQVSLILVLVYAVTRSTIEAFRGDDLARGTWFGGVVSTSQLISAVVGIVALFLLVKHHARRESYEPAVV